ncbi:MAG TPA: hypothetical protein VJJ02_00190 [Candidatus Paceibacterota bacterium]
MRNNLRAERLKMAMASLNEFCNICFRDLGFSKALPVDHPRRYENGACYVDGAGQTCGDCNRLIAEKGETAEKAS